MEGNFKGQRVVMQMFRIVGNEKEIVYLGIPAEAGIQSCFEIQKCAGSRPGRRACCLARPEERTYRLVRLEERNLCVEAKGPRRLGAKPH